MGGWWRCWSLHFGCCSWPCSHLTVTGQDCHCMVHRWCLWRCKLDGWLDSLQQAFLSLARQRLCATCPSLKQELLHLPVMHQCLIDSCCWTSAWTCLELTGDSPLATLCDSSGPPCPRGSPSHLDWCLLEGDQAKREGPLTQDHFQRLLGTNSGLRGEGTPS